MKGESALAKIKIMFRQMEEVINMFGVVGLLFSTRSRQQQFGESGEYLAQFHGIVLYLEEFKCNW